MNREDSWSDEKREFYKKLGAEIRHKRVMKYMTQTDLAKEIDVSPVWINHIEHGKRNLSMFNYHQIMNAIDKKINAK